jgi:ABC-type multidrug transport system fused ATPase/permease subunit
VKNADIIAAVSEGYIKEIGTHEELVAKRGLYHTLLKMQVLALIHTQFHYQFFY